MPLKKKVQNDAEMEVSDEDSDDSSKEMDEYNEVRQCYDQKHVNERRLYSFTIFSLGNSSRFRRKKSNRQRFRWYSSIVESVAAQVRREHIRIS